MSGSRGDDVGMDVGPSSSSPSPVADRFARVRTAFHALMELDLSQRQRRLDEVDDEDPGLATDLRALLERLDETDLLPTPEKTPPSRLGPFRVLHRIGRGGMGEVYLAERVEGDFEQRVAIKCVSSTAFSPDLTRRFLRERQILAQLSHPNIAHLVDGGIDENGQPWLAMEYVDGMRLPEWCAARGLDLAARVRLYLPVCEAVAFAHRNLVVHSDLKPDNIFVDAEGRPKLLDFGIARLLDTDQALRTRTQVALTPAYAAPEQLEGGDITTATDVFQLGMVLRELATGERADRAVPSSTRALRGDLGRILDKACERAPGDRYAGVAAFADDLRDWLERKPLRSGIGSRRERLRKTLWQWRWPLALIGVAILTLGGGALLALRQAQEKAREAEVSQQVTQFLIDLFRGADPTVAQGASLSAQDLLDQGNARLHGAERLRPDVRSRLLQTVAETYVALGQYERALVPAQEALNARRTQRLTPEHADSLAQVGTILRLMANYTGAEPMLGEALELRRALLPKDDAATIESLVQLAALESAQGDFAKADVLFSEAAQAAQRHFGKDAVETARYLDLYAGNLDDLGRRSEAQELLRRSLEIRERALGPDAPEVATALSSLGVHQSTSGHYDEAVALLERALSIRTRIFGADHPLAAFAQLDLAGAYLDREQLDAAESQAREALAKIRASLAPTHPKTTEALNMLALVRMVRRDFIGAIPAQEEVVELYSKRSGPNHPDTLTVKNNLAYALLRAGRVAEAEALLRESIALKREDNGQTVNDYLNLGIALSLQGKHAQALEVSRRALQMQSAREGAVSANTAVALREVAFAEDMAGDPTGAERDYRAALAMAEATVKGRDRSMAGWVAPLAAFLVGADRCAEAMPLLQQAREGKAGSTDAIGRHQLQLLHGECVPEREGANSVREACRALHAIPGVEVDVYPTTRRLLATRCTSFLGH